jgi:hypothetical protein
MDDGFSFSVLLSCSGLVLGLFQLPCYEGKTLVVASCCYVAQPVVWPLERRNTGAVGHIGMGAHQGKRLHQDTQKVDSKYTSYS